MCRFIRQKHHFLNDTSSFNSVTLICSFFLDAWKCNAKWSQFIFLTRTWKANIQNENSQAKNAFSLFFLSSRCETPLSHSVALSARKSALFFPALFPELNESCCKPRPTDACLSSGSSKEILYSDSWCRRFKPQIYSTRLSPRRH